MDGQADWFKAYLQVADDAAEPPRPPTNLSAVVLRRAADRQRRWARGVVGLAAACTLLAVPLFPLGRDRHASAGADSVARGGRVAAWRVELAALRRERRLHEMTAARLLAAEQANQPAHCSEVVYLPSPDPTVAVREQLDRAAETLVLQAARLAERYGRTEAAARTYRSVVERFPDSPWAAVARAQLRLLEQSRVRS